VRFPFGETLAIAHRGAHGPGRPENSLAALERALQIGAPAVEFDVCNLADGVLVISHDGVVSALGGRRPLPEISSGELDLSTAGETSAVEPFLEAVATSDAFLNFDWKGSGAERRIGELLGLYGLVERTIVSADDPQTIRRMRDGTPSLTVGISVSADTALPGNVPSILRRSRADAVMLDYALAGEEVTAAIRRAGAGLFLWTARDRKAFNRLLRLSPDGIATDAIEELMADR
jgi:glycerophosphoryl diester phosphodiesterase